MLQCSVTCGKGKRTREVYCGNSPTESDEALCTDRRPDTSETCALSPCQGLFAETQK